MVEFGEVGGYDKHTTIKVDLPHDISGYGSLSVFIDGVLVLGPFVVRGTAHLGDKAKKFNPSLDPLKPYGHTPNGVYNGTFIHSDNRTSTGERFSEVLSASGKLTYGSQGFFYLRPKSGPALLAKNNGRTSLGMHAGGTADNGGLRPTNGCIRLYPADMAQLFGYLVANKSEVAVGISQAPAGKVIVGRPPPYARPDEGENDVDPIQPADIRQDPVKLSLSEYKTVLYFDKILEHIYQAAVNIPYYMPPTRFANYIKRITREWEPPFKFDYDYIISARSSVDDLYPQQAMYDFFGVSETVTRDEYDFARGLIKAKLSQSPSRHGNYDLPESSLGLPEGDLDSGMADGYDTPDYSLPDYDDHSRGNGDGGWDLDSANNGGSQGVDDDWHSWAEDESTLDSDWDRGEDWGDWTPPERPPLA